MSVITPGGADVPEIEDGLYQATVLQVTDIELDEPDQFGNTSKVEVQISFTDTDGTKHTLEPRVNRRWGERATLHTIAQACGCECNPNAPFDTEDLVGKKVAVLVETLEAGRWPRVKTWTKAAKGRTSQETPPVASTAATERISGPAWVNESGDIEWRVWWGQVEKYGGTREGIAKKVGGLDKLDQMDVGQLADILAAMTN
jgi:hypothetical protein